MDLGSAVLTLTVDSGQLDSGMKQAKEKTDVLQASVTKLLGVYAGVEGIKKFVALVKDCVSEFIESENAATRLTAALRATDQEYTNASKGLQDFAKDLQRTTIYSDEATEGAAAMLIQLGGLTEQGVKRAIPAVMDLAAAMGMDLESAAMLASKALEGNVGALSRYGIHVDKASIPSAQFDVVIQALTSHFGGMAQAMAKTTGGELKQFTNQISEAKEAAGGFFAQFVRGYVSWFREFVEGLQMTWHALEHVWWLWRDITNLKNPFGKDSTANVIERARAMTELDKEMKLWEEMQYSGLEAMTQTNEAFEKGTEAVIKFNEGTRNFINTWVALGRAYADQQIQLGIQAMADRWVALGDAVEEQTDRMREDTAALFAGWGKAAVGEGQTAANDMIAMLDGWAKASVGKAKEVSAAFKVTYRDIDRTVGQVLDSLGGISDQYFANQNTELDNWYEAQIAALGDMTNATVEQIAAKEKIDKEYAAKQKEIKKREWEVNKGLTVANVIISTIEAVVKTLAAYPWPWNLIPAAIVGALGAVQLGLVLSQPEPKFKTGTDFVVPPGYEDDSYRMRVASGERVSVTPAGAGEQIIHNTLVLDGAVLADWYTRASREQRILTNARSVVP